ncbi:MAG: ABC transporter substrate-binding protein [Lachnospiraceae bacterium]|nr:ABC transporter substrate-binding protein [Lachnospiraceae bacterium]
MNKESKIKKRIILAVLTSAAVCLTAGCSGSGDSVSNDSTTEAEEKTVINVVRCVNNLASADSEEVQKVEDAINEYIGDLIGVEINLTEIGSGEYIDKCNLSLANSEINLLWTANWMGAISCDSLVQANAVYDITELLEGTTLYDSMPESVWEASQYDGNAYFIPVYKEVAEGYDLMFRKDLADKYGWDLDSITELADIEPMLEDCLNDDTVEAPLLLQSSNVAYKFLLDQYDWIIGEALVGVDKETNEVVNVVETEEYRELCMLMSDWSEKGYILEGDATKSNPTSVLYSQYWGISWWTDVPNNDEANTRYGQEVEMVHVTQNWISSSSTLGSCYTIAKTSTEAEAQACIEFLGLLYTDNTLADLFTYGIEGTDYDYDDDGYVVKKGELYNHSAWESCSVRSVSLEEGEPENKVELVETFNEEGVESAASGFRLDNTEIEAKLDACSNVYDQYGFVLENGGYTTAEVDDILAEYQEALDEAGYQDVLDEVTRQYEEWKAA